MKKFLSVALALAMTLSLVVVGASAKSFTDSSKVTYKEAVNVISSCKVIDGYTDGSFAPTNTLTRGAAAKIICNMMLSPTAASALGVSTAPFKDVSTSNVFAGYIAYCAKQGIISGYSDKTFRPAGTVTGYQFLKMLLGALGYDSTIESFTGSNWEVSVAKLASNLGLYDGNDSFVGTKALTREEACLYAYNTLTATMVEYDTKGTTITINGVTIAQGASKAKAVTRTTGTNYTNVAESGSTTGCGTLQFCEQYFKNLKQNTGVSTDAFGRPAITWMNGTTTIGTYADTSVKSYSTYVTLGSLYSDLGLSASTGYTLYVNGTKTTVASTDAQAIVKGSDTYLANVGRGTLTEAYKDSNGAVTIVVVDTYVGDVTAVAAATSSKDRTVTIATRKGVSGSFASDTLKVDDIVLYTYSNMSGYVGIQSAEVAKTVSGTVTAYTTGSKVTLGTTSYSYSKQIANPAANTGNTATVVLDAYGYAIDVDTSVTSTNFAVVLATNETWGGTVHQARLLFTDGTTKDVETTAKATDGSIVAYSVNSTGKYILSASTASTYAATATSAAVTANATVTTNNSYNLSGIKASMTGNGSTIFLVASTSGTSTVYTAYTGIKNVPTITLSGNAGLPVTCYAKTTNLATVVYIDATTGCTINNSTSTSNAIFVYHPYAAKRVVDSAKGVYYTYDAVVNGEVTTLNVAEATLNTEPVTTSAMYTGITYDSNKIATLSSPVSMINALTKTSLTYGTGAVKAANSVIGLNGTYYGYTSTCKVFNIDTDGNITATSVASIATDKTDNVYFVTNSDNDVTTIVVEQNVSSVNTVTAEAAKVTGANLTVTSPATVSDTAKTVKATVTGTAVKNDAITVTLTPAAGATVNPSTVTLTYDGTAWSTSNAVVVAEDGTTATYAVSVNAVVPSTANNFDVAAITGEAGATATTAVTVATATGATTKAITVNVAESVATNKTVNLVISNKAAGSTVNVSPATAQNLANGTVKYDFTVTATAESGAQQVCTVSVTFDSVGA